MIEMMKRLKQLFLRIIELSLGLHGAMHFIEFGSAMYEGAYLTASLAAFGGLTMVAGAVFLGHTHHHGNHHHHHHHHDDEESSEASSE